MNLDPAHQNDTSSGDGATAHSSDLLLTMFLICHTYTGQRCLSATPGRDQFAEHQAECLHTTGRVTSILRKRCIPLPQDLDAVRGEVVK